MELTLQAVKFAMLGVSYTVINTYSTSCPIGQWVEV
jgi:hypothetical protein